MNAALIIGMCCLEMEAIAVTINLMTGWSYTVSAILGRRSSGIVCTAGRYERNRMAESDQCHRNVSGADPGIYQSDL